MTSFLRILVVVPILLMLALYVVFVIVYESQDEMEEEAGCVCAEGWTGDTCITCIDRVEYRDSGGPRMNVKIVEDENNAMTKWIKYI